MDKIEKKVIILEVDQFTSTGGVFDLNKIAASAMRGRLGRIGSSSIRGVGEKDLPGWGQVWYRSDESGKFVLWKDNCDSSG